MGIAPSGGQAPSKCAYLHHDDGAAAAVQQRLHPRQQLGPPGVHRRKIIRVLRPQLHCPPAAYLGKRKKECGTHPVLLLCHAYSAGQPSWLEATGMQTQLGMRTQCRGLQPAVPLAHSDCTPMHGMVQSKVLCSTLDDASQ